MKSLKITVLAVTALVGLSAPAHAGYSSSIPAPMIYQTNWIVSSGNFPVLQTSGPAITTISWAVGYTFTTQGTTQVQICVTGSTTNCTSWGSLRGSSSAFGGYPIGTQFYFRARVVSSSTVVLNPAVAPSGSSNLIVNN